MPATPRPSLETCLPPSPILPLKCPAGPCLEWTAAAAAPGPGAWRARDGWGLFFAAYFIMTVSFFRVTLDLMEFLELKDLL